MFIFNMSVQYYCLLVCLFVAVHYSDADPVSFIKKCKGSDSKCLKESAQAAVPVYTLGVPELNVEPLDPLFFKKLDASTSGLSLVVTDATITGLKGCHIKKLQRDLVKSKLMAKIQCDINLDGQYVMKGTLIILPIEGKGAVKAKLRKINIVVEADMEEKPGKDGKLFWNIKSWKHSYELKDKADVHFEGLFPNNELLGRAARDLVANNGNDIILEVGPPVIKSVIGRMIQGVQKFFHTVPLEDLVEQE